MFDVLEESLYDYKLHPSLHTSDIGGRSAGYETGVQEGKVQYEGVLWGHLAITIPLDLPSGFARTVKSITVPIVLIRDLSVSMERRMFFIFAPHAILMRTG
jgi:hypothetical protein